MDIGTRLAASVAIGLMAAVVVVLFETLRAFFSDRPADLRKAYSQAVKVMPVATLVVFIMGPQHFIGALRILASLS